jgi:hypothetical protein
MRLGIRSIHIRPSKSLPRGSKRYFYESMSRSSPIVLPPVGAHKGTLIFLHGLGDTGMQTTLADSALSNVFSGAAPPASY